MKTIRVGLGDRAYDIRVGVDLPIGQCLAGERVSRALIVSDSNVDPIYGETCQDKLRKQGIAACRTAIPAGEESKDLARVKDLYDRALESGLDRASVIVALGGGVVGDLAGFVAGTFLRGIRYIQVPTTLLAMVDSSVGGKTGVNLPQGKNLAGVFHQPAEVVADLLTLRTLPEREYVSGLAEVIKYGVIRDARLFENLEKNADRLLQRDPDLLEEVVVRCCEIKAEVVGADEHESGMRAILNFGHTFGHGLEKASGYGKWLHGEAVAVGMVLAAGVSVADKGLRREACERLRKLLQRVGLPVTPAGAGGDLTWPDLRAAMQTDKKSRGRSLRLVLAKEMGSVVYGCEVSDKVLEEVFRRVAG